MRTALLVLMLIATPLPAETVWKWVDAKGVTHYSDRPVPGAERVELNVGTTGTVPPPPLDATTPPPERREETAPGYRTFEISAPTNDQAIINTGGQVQVAVRVIPNLRPGDTLSLFLDGKRVDGFAPNTQQFALTDIPRGTHQVVAVITNSQGRRIAETGPVVFHVRQTSILNPNNPNNPNRART